MGACIGVLNGLLPWLLAEALGALDKEEDRG